MRIKVFTTGGTIDKVYFDAKSDYEVGEPQIAEILREANIALEYDVETIFRKDSLDLTGANRAEIRRRVLADPAAKILVTHGTDTMRETALALGDVGAKTVVLVGSLTPARFKHSDAEFNIGFALGALEALGPGVFIAMNGRIFDPRRVRKNREKNRFEEATGAPPSAPAAPPRSAKGAAPRRPASARHRRG
jgi:L-asparaginase